MVETNHVVSSSVGKHWTHQRFVQNLLNASRARDLADAAKEWNFYKIHSSRTVERCHLCNAQILNCVILKNTENGNFVVMGEDCYDKLIHFLDEGKVESTLPRRDKKAGELRTYWKGLLKAFEDKTVLGWLRDELTAGHLIGVVASIVYTIIKLGFAPTTGDADRVVSYYKSTRKFKFGELIKLFELNGFRHQKFLPAEITIDEASRIMKMVEKDRQISGKLREIERLKKRVSVVRFSLWDLRKEAEKAVRAKVKTASSIVSAAEEILGKIAEMASPLSVDEIYSIQVLVEKLRQKSRWALKNPEVLLFVRDPEGSYIFLKKEGFWRRYSNVEKYATKGLVLKTGLFKAVIDRELFHMTVCFQEELDSSKVVVELEFTEENPAYETYVGCLGDKAVIPLEPIRHPGKYKVFLAEDEGWCYRSFVI